MFIRLHIHARSLAFFSYTNTTAILPDKIVQTYTMLVVSVWLDEQTMFEKTNTNAHISHKCDDM